MTEQRKFHLTIWEATDEFKESHRQAYERLAVLRSKLRGGKRQVHPSELGVGEGGIFEVWLNSSSNYLDRKHVDTYDKAVQFALNHGDTGYWTLDELERFVNGEGIILDFAMCNLGYRRSKNNARRWARFRNRNERATYQIPKIERRPTKHFLDITDEERERLGSLFHDYNDDPVNTRRYDLQADHRGMIHIEVPGVFNRVPRINPDTSSVELKFLTYDCHVNTIQDGFNLEARNVQLDDKGVVVYIKALKPGKPLYESVWPSVLREKLLYILAEDLVSRVSSLQ